MRTDMEMADGPNSTPARHCDLLIVWHSRTGAARQLAAAAFDGAMGVERDSGVSDESQSAPATAQAGRSSHHESGYSIYCDEVGPNHVLMARALLFVCPENLGSMSGEMKAFFDRCYYPLLDRIEGRPYALIVSAGSDGAGTVRQIERIATGWRLRQVAPSTIVNIDAQTPEQILAAKTVPAVDLANASELGAALANGARMGIF